MYAADILKSRQHFYDKKIGRLININKYGSVDIAKFWTLYLSCRAQQKKLDSKPLIRISSGLIGSIVYLL